MLSILVMVIIITNKVDGREPLKMIETFIA